MGKFIFGLLKCRKFENIIVLLCRCLKVKLKLKTRFRQNP